MGWVADLLKEIPSAARYKAELDALEEENVAIKSQTKILELEISLLRQEIKRRDDVIQKQESHDNRLGDVKEKILLAIASGIPTVEKLAGDVCLPEQAIRFHLEDPSMSTLILEERAAGFAFVSLAPAGRLYLVKHGLLKVD